MRVFSIHERMDASHVNVYIRVVDIPVVAIYIHAIEASPSKTHMEESMKLTRVLVFGFVMAVMVSSAFAQKKSAEPIKVFVGARTNGFADGRSDTVRDLKSELYEKNKIVFSSQEEADVVIEVLDRSRGDSGTVSATTISLRVSAGGYSADMYGSYAGEAPGPWGLAAWDAAKKIQKWIKDNHDKLIALRVQK